jgi:sporulation protein YlmC with PRC-barrel domain
MKSVLAVALLGAAVIGGAAFAQSTQPADRAATATTGQPAHAQMALKGSWRASKLMGLNVYNEANEKLGDINELLVDKSGKIEAVVIGVGGFLGMGEHEVAMSFESLRLSQDSNGKLLVVFNATKDSLKAAPAWTWTGSDRSSTSGTSTAPSNKPMNPSK